VYQRTRKFTAGVVQPGLPTEESHGFSRVEEVKLGTAFGLLAPGIEAFWVVFPVGFGGVLPIALGLVVVWTSANH